MYLTVLDPSLKLAYIKKNWGPNFIARTRAILEKIVSLHVLIHRVIIECPFQFDEYNQAAQDIKVVHSSSQTGQYRYYLWQFTFDSRGVHLVANNNAVGYGSNWMQRSLDDDSDDDDIPDPHKELNEYLDSKREDRQEGLVEWWGVSLT
jgi:hypothetical protein